MRMCVCILMLRASVCVCARVRVRARVYEGECVCVCVCMRECVRALCEEKCACENVSMDESVCVNMYMYIPAHATQRPVSAQRQIAFALAACLHTQIAREIRAVPTAALPAARVYGCL